MNKTLLTGFINKFNFKEVIEDVEIEVTAEGNRVKCFGNGRVVLTEIKVKDFLFNKTFILPDISRFVSFLNLFSGDFEYDIIEKDDKPYTIKLYNDSVNFEYGLGEEVLFKFNRADELPIVAEDINIGIDEKQAGLILNSLKLSTSDFITIVADKHNMYLRIGDQKKKEPIVEIALNGTINHLTKEMSSCFDAKTFATVLNVNKKCNIRVKFEKGGMILESADENYDCTYMFNPMIKNKE